MNHRALIQSPLGDILLHLTDDALSGLYFVGQKYCPAADDVARHDHGAGVSRIVRQIEDEIAGYFAGDVQRFSVALQPLGTPFQQRVWQALREIPYGEVDSYGRIAQRLGLPPGSARAVGAANGRNPVSIIVPCHRVVAGNGDLTGYAGGIDRKRALLALERRVCGEPQQLDLLDSFGDADHTW